MNKKAICAFAGALACALAFTGCSGGGSRSLATVKKTTPDTYPIQTDETVTYWVELSGHVSAHSQSLNDTEFAKNLIKETGINVEFVHPAIGQEKEQFNLMIASGDLPDIIESGWFTYAGGPEKAISEGTILPLNQIIDTVSPNIKKLFDEHPDYKKNVMSDKGNIYAYPFVRGDEILQTYIGPMVREDLLEKHNLEKPETIAEWETMLRAFKSDGIKAPLVVKLDNKTMDGVSPIVGAFGIGGTFYVDNGKVKYGPYEPAYKEFVTLMARWYSEGLLDSNFADVDGKRITSLMANGDGGSAFGSAGGDFGKWIPALEVKNPDAKFVPVKYPVMNKGDRPQFGQKLFPVEGSGAAISGMSKNVELAARLLDYGYSEKGHMLYNFGKENESYTMNGDVPTYTDVIMDSDKNGGLGIGPAMGKYIRACYNGPFVQDVNYLNQFYAIPQQLEAVNVWSDTDMLGHKMPFSPLTQEENREYTKIMQDIDTYRQEVLYKTISGTSSLAEFETYFSEMKDRGIERAIEIQQAAYDRYLAN